MAKGQKFRYSGLESGQGLLPGIPDEITMKDIASKLKWETCNMMQMVSREWRLVISSRRVYEARVLSDSTAAFLVLVYFLKANTRPVLILYSCIDGTFLELPPTPGPTGTCYPALECICLDGIIYLWELAGSYADHSVLWVLDLAGDRRWTKREWVKCWRAMNHFRIGVLGGKIYGFRGNSRPDQCVLKASASDDLDLVSLLHYWSQLAYLPQTSASDDLDLDSLVHYWSQLAYLPQTEVYHPHSNVWSSITPERPILMHNFEIEHYLTPISECEGEELLDDSSETFERHHSFVSYLMTFSKWEEQLQTDPSITIGPYESFLSKWRTTDPSTAIGRYESFYSEWRAWHSTTLAVQKGRSRSHELATQVYDTDVMIGSDTTEKILFFREKLVKVIQHGRHRQPLGVDIQAYDTEKEAWVRWKSFPAPHVRTNCVLMGGAGIRNCIFVENVMWAFVAMQCEVCLMRRSMLLDDEAGGDSAEWIDTGCSMVHCDASLSVLRPIYL